MSTQLSSQHTTELHALKPLIATYATVHKVILYNGDAKVKTSNAPYIPNHLQLSRMPCHSSHTSVCKPVNRHESLQLASSSILVTLHTSGPVTCRREPCVSHEACVQLCRHACTTNVRLHVHMYCLKLPQWLLRCCQAVPHSLQCTTCSHSGGCARSPAMLCVHFEVIWAILMYVHKHACSSASQ